MGQGNGVDILQSMSDPVGDLRQCWVQFDHVKRAKGSSIMIAVCEFLHKKYDSQLLFWTLLNNACLKKGVHANIRKFMADGPLANWSDVRQVYNGRRTNIMEGKEKTCDFH
jgi:hypothetical protein